jgi:transposase-like protein
MSKRKTLNKSGFDFSEFENQLISHVRKNGGTSGIGGQNFVEELMSRTYQALLDAELEEHLANEKEANIPNNRNGRGTKKIRGNFGEVEINPPRDRNATFDPEIVKKRSSTVGNFTDKIVSLYARGMTTREISAHLEEIYQIELSESFVSRAVSGIQAEVQDWQNRPLEEIYPILYVDGIRFNVRGENGKVIKKCFYTVLGVSIEGVQDVLGLWIADTEGASFWLSVLTELKQRGVQDVLIACVDGLTGMPDAFEAVFPQADVQLCIVHQVRNCTKFVSYKDRKEICADMKKIYHAVNEKDAKNALNELKQKWGKQYPAVIQSWGNKWSLLINFLKYPQEIRKITYTTNAIEAVHSLLRKNTKNRKIFPNDDALFRLLYLNIKNLSKKWTKRTGWNIVVNQFSILFEQRINKYLLDEIGN